MQLALGITLVSRPCASLDLDFTTKRISQLRWYRNADVPLLLCGKEGQSGGWVGHWGWP
jgi:hypothetical protein